MEGHETILPPPPTMRIVAWASANRFWYRALAALCFGLAAVAQWGRRTLARVQSFVLQRLIAALRLRATSTELEGSPALERETAVEVRRGGPRAPTASGLTSRRSRITPRITRVSSLRPTV